MKAENVLSMHKKTTLLCEAWFVTIAGGKNLDNSTDAICPTDYFMQSTIRMYK